MHKKNELLRWPFTHSPVKDSKNLEEFSPHKEQVYAKHQ